MEDMLLKKLRDRTGVTYQSLERDLQNLPALETMAEEEVRFSSEATHDSKSYKAARFVLAAKLFSKPYARGLDWNTITFEDDVHLEIVKYIRNCEASGQAPHTRDLFDRFGMEEQELNKILDLFCDDLETKTAEKFYKDSVLVLQREQIEKHLPILTEAYRVETDVEKRKQIAKELNEVILRSKGLK
jgi:hypothetical protein